MTWLDVMGLTEDGLDGLTRDQLARVRGAGLVIGPDRVRDAVTALDGFGGSAEAWPVPFLDIIPRLQSRRGEAVVILATGDPLWYGAASTLVRYFNAEEMRITPAPSGFQWAASRMGWPLHTTRTLTVHGRPHETVLKYLAPSARLLVLAHDRQSPHKLARLLLAAGYGAAQITALGHIGGGQESAHAAPAQDWVSPPHDAPDLHVPDFHVIAIACPDAVEGFLPLTPGLPDEAFQSDGKLTKAETRAASLAKLKPQDGGMLWDLGCGSGAIGIEWMRAGVNARAIGVDHRDDRLQVARGNADRLGTPEWQGMKRDLSHALDDKALDDKGLDDLPDPDAVFIGGGLTVALAELAFKRLKPGGRLVANAVTLESEAVLLALWQAHGGELTRIAVSRAEPVGPLHGWRPLMPVTQWALEKPRAAQGEGGEDRS
ncbi:MAG: precorrin-6y C5,15-methyltransferase (decarboxylating) subunit CbiE [Alphaproteobacteria bacterium]|nr:precorrin-6y C5,15-methyltransferase (decarboxylating) subunit CbiE [Alphaproteobacteria bacterium]